MSVSVSILLVVAFSSITVFGIIPLAFLFTEKQQRKRFLKLAGIMFGAFVILIGCSVSSASIKMDTSEKIELHANETHDVTIDLIDWKNADVLYIGEVWQEAGDDTLQTDVKTLEVTAKDIANEAVTISNSIAENEVRKLITVTMEKSDAGKFVKATVDTYKVTPMDAETFDDYIQAPEDTEGFVSYLNGDLKAHHVIAQQEKEVKAAKEEKAKKEATKEKEAADKKKVEAEANKKLAGMKVHFIDVGQADAALIQFDDKAILIDSGDWNRNETVTYLQNQGIKKIDIMVGSHPHADHIGQMDKVIDNFDVDEVWMSGGITTSQVFERVLTSIDDNDIGYDEPRAGDSYQIGDLQIDILSPSSITDNLNDDSIVMKVTYGAVSFLFTGDAETPAEDRMVSSGQDLSATILKAGHHGSDTSTTQSFLDKVNPEVTVISVAENSKYDHPAHSVIDRINAKKIDLYATKTHGNIVISTDGTSYTIATDRSGKVTAGTSEKKPAKQVASTQTTSKPSKKEEKKVSNANCIDINKASEAELQNIKHIGPATAPKVIDARTFNSVDELTRVSGIAEKKIADIKAEGKACVN